MIFIKDYQHIGEKIQSWRSPAFSPQTGQVATIHTAGGKVFQGIVLRDRGETVELLSRGSRLQRVTIAKEHIVAVETAIV